MTQAQAAAGAASQWMSRFGGSAMIAWLLIGALVLLIVLCVSVFLTGESRKRGG